MTLTITGGCLCGAVRYESDDPPSRGLCCHCDVCQKQASGPMMQLFFVRAEKFRIVKGEAQTFASSETGRRDFCASCCTPIAFRRSTRPEIISVMGGSLDDPSLFRASYHTWTSDDRAWFHEGDVLMHEERLPQEALKKLLAFDN
jgi:hypothetical protein